MNSRERVRTIISGQAADRCGLWIGNPHPDTWPILHKHFGTESEEQFRRKFQDDFRWICPQFFPDAYTSEEGKLLFDAGLGMIQTAQPPLAHVKTLDDVEDYNWPDPNDMVFDTCIETLKNAGDVYRASGFWTCFYHNIMDLVGMENYMMWMYSEPEIIHSITDHVCNFYYDANERFFEAAGDLVDGYFFGNDFGTQQDLICGPKQFDEFIMPWFKKFTQQGHRHGYQVILHSCGAIHKVIGRLIDAGVDCLHPLQALAANMDAETLARDFKGRIAFMGGIDTQQLLVSAAPEEVQAEVRRVKALLGPSLIVSPSHEALLPNIPPENVQAFAEAAIENES